MTAVAKCRFGQLGLGKLTRFFTESHPQGRKQLDKRPSILNTLLSYIGIYSHEMVQS